MQELDVLARLTFLGVGGVLSLEPSVEVVMDSMFKTDFFFF